MAKTGAQRRSVARERENLAQRLRQLRSARGLSQAELAGVEFTKGFVSQLETARVGLSLRAAQIFAHRLGVPVADLVSTPDESDRVREIALLEAERELADGSAARALELSQDLPRGTGLTGRILRLRGRALVKVERAADAIVPLEQAIEAFRRESDTESVIRTMHDLAYAHARLDHPQQALVLLLQCEQALRAASLVDRTFELEVEAFLAAVYARMGDAAAAEPHLERAKQVAEDVVDHDALAALYQRLASAEQQAGQYARAVDLWKRSLKELELAGRERLVGDAWHNVAAAYIRLGQYEKARQALSRSEEIQRATGHERLGTWLKVTRARLALETRRLSDAESMAREAAGDRAASALARGEALLVLGQVLTKKRAPAAKIRQAYDAALKELDEEPVGSRVRALKLYADALHAIGDLGAAFTRARQALELARPGN